MCVCVCYRNIPVLIDAAHALGQTHVDITDLDADYYVTNCHKWLCAPRWGHAGHKPD